MIVMRCKGRTRQLSATMVAVAVLSGGCGAGSSSAVPATDSLAVAPEQAASAGSGAAPLDPEAPSQYRPVVRNGARPDPAVAAPPGGFTRAEPVRYPDGVSVRVDRVERTVERGEGPGVFPGRPQTAVSMTLTNGSARPIDLTQVVVTTTYGVRPRVASPVYAHPAAGDFYGVVQPGGTATATYVFAIPPGQARTVRTMVDFDDVHAAATITGLGER
jgi:hypothetical protein